MLIITIIGPPGSGKGTHSKMAASFFDLIHLDTGDLLRKKANTNPHLKKLIDEGKFVPVPILEEMINENINELTAEKGVILDGYPRNLSQAKGLNEILASRGLSLDLVIYLDVPERESMFRIIKRSAKSNREDDKDPFIIIRRFKIYKEQTYPLLEYYEKKHLLKKIDGTGSVENTFFKIKNAIANVLKN